MGGRDVGFFPHAKCQQCSANLVETDIALKEPACHLRLPSETAEIDDGAGMGHRLGTDVGGIGNGDGTGGVWCHRRHARIRGRMGFGREPITVHKVDVPHGIGIVVVRRTFLWRSVGDCDLIARGFILSRIDNNLGERGRRIAEASNVEPRGDPDRLGDAVSKAEIQRILRI